MTLDGFAVHSAILNIDVSATLARVHGEKGRAGVGEGEVPGLPDPFQDPSLVRKVLAKPTKFLWKYVSYILVSTVQFK